MAITIRERLAPSWYTPKSEEGDPTPTRFRVRPLDGAEQLEAYGFLSIDEETGVSFINTKGLVFCCMRGVTDWENPPFKMPDGGDKPFNAADLRKLDPLLIRELGMRVFSMTELGEHAEKNS